MKLEVGIKSRLDNETDRKIYQKYSELFKDPKYNLDDLKRALVLEKNEIERDEKKQSNEPDYIAYIFGSIAIPFSILAFLISILSMKNVTTPIARTTTETFFFGVLMVSNILVVSILICRKARSWHLKNIDILSDRKIEKLFIISCLEEEMQRRKNKN